MSATTLSETLTVLVPYVAAIMGVPDDVAAAALAEDRVPTAIVAAALLQHNHPDEEVVSIARHVAEDDLDNAIEDIVDAAADGAIMGNLTSEVQTVARREIRSLLPHIADDDLGDVVARIVCAAVDGDELDCLDIELRLTADREIRGLLERAHIEIR